MWALRAHDSANFYEKIFDFIHTWVYLLSNENMSASGSASAVFQNRKAIWN